MGGLDQTTWQALGLTLTVLGLGVSVLVWRRRGATAGLRAVAWSLLPLAAALTGTLQLLFRLVDAVVDWAVRLVLSPTVWVGIVLAGVAGVLFVVTGFLRRRSPRTGPASGELSSTRSAPPATVSGSTPATSGTGDRGGSAAEDGLDDDVEAILRKHGIT